MESNVAQLLGVAAEREPERIALVEATSGRRVTWRELDALVDAGAYISQVLGRPPASRAGKALLTRRAASA